jgi:N utilization substance protein B
LSSRKKARESLLKALYLSESRSLTILQALDEMEATDREIERSAGEPEAESLKPFALGLEPEHREYANALATVIEKSRERYNDLIRPVLVNWELARIARIDRMIMWIAMAELETMLDVPAPVAISEAVDLARRFSSEKSPGFINGVLDSIARNMGVITARPSSRPSSGHTGKRRKT